jgi:membrane-associated phospholipid phosphatase
VRGAERRTPPPRLRTGTDPALVLPVRPAVPGRWWTRSSALRRRVAWSVTTAVVLAAQPAFAGAARTTRVDDRTTLYDLGAHGEFLYRKPTWYRWIVQPVPDIGIYARDTFRPRNAVPILGLAALTALPLWLDRPLIHAVQSAGEEVGIPPRQDGMRTLVNAGGLRLQAPGTLGATLRFLGDGSAQVSIGTVMLGWGLWHDDNRAIQTGSQVLQVFLSSGALAQVLKHATGRQIPNRATEVGGEWEFFPNQQAYFHDISSYDAFPSGHLTSATATLTVLAGNYPENRYIKPVGCTMLALLALQMMNRGVHWASDYPLAIALGYGLGKVAVRGGREAAPGFRPPDRGGSLLSRIRPTVILGDRGQVLAGLGYGFGG